MMGREKLTKLKTTIRCLVEDLNLDPETARGPVEEIDHLICRAFVAQRSQSPEGTEKVQPITTNAEVYTLHAGRWRGATWHDRDHDVVWLLGCGYHRSGKVDDVYPYIKSLDAKDQLFPTADDYELLFEEQDRTFAQALIDEAPKLLTDAHERAPEEVRSVLGGTVRVSVWMEIAKGLEVTWLAVSMRFVHGGLEPPEGWLPLILAAFFPDVGDPFEELHVSDQDLPTRSKEDDELVFAHYRDLE